MIKDKRFENWNDKDLGYILWDYNELDMPLKNSDVLIVLGSNDIRVAEYAAELYHKKLAPLVIVSGGVAHNNDLLATGWDKPEAMVFLDSMVELGVPETTILVEANSTNTGENFTNSRELLKKLGKTIKSGLIVQKPFMERRALATGEKQWSEISWSVTSPNISFDDFAKTFSEESLINILVGDTHRITEYYELGYQTKQKIPEVVNATMIELINRGYVEHIPQ